MSERILTNARIVTAGDIIEAGTLVIADGAIGAVDPAICRKAPAIDLEGDYLLPGFVELHTDNLEKHFMPRPGVRWPANDAVIAHDAQVAAAGITTVFDALAVGDIGTNSARIEGLRDLLDAIEAFAATGLTRAEHLIHARCEVSYEGADAMFAGLAGGQLLRLVSVMDHTPGQRQFLDPEKLKQYYTRKYAMSDPAYAEFIRDRIASSERHSARQRSAIVALAKQHGYALASHDDATPEHIAEAVADGASIAEFPTTLLAARTARDAGLDILVGSPNVVLGGSHSGNIAATELVAAGAADILSSDYVPSSLVQAVFSLADAAIDLPTAVCMAAKNPAEAVGLEDRGEIAAGKRADWLRVCRVDGRPVIREVWRQGERVV